MGKFQFRKRAASAAASAAAAAAVKNSGDTHKFLSFRLGDENFGIPILNIKEIIEYGNLTEIPMMPDFIRGAINLRGHIVPIMDLAVRLGRDSFDVSRRTCIVIVEMLLNNEKLDVGVVVDAVNEVLDIEPSEIDPAPSFGGHVQSEFLLGMGKIGESFLVLLNMDKVITHADVHALQTAGSDFGMSMGKNAKSGKQSAKPASKQTQKSGSTTKANTKPHARAVHYEDDTEEKVERAEHAVHAEYAEYAIHAEHAMHAEHVAHDVASESSEVAVLEKPSNDEATVHVTHSMHEEPVVSEHVVQQIMPEANAETDSHATRVEHHLPDESDMQALQDAVAMHEISMVRSEMETEGDHDRVDHYISHENHDHDVSSVSESGNMSESNHEQSAKLEGKDPNSSNDDDDGPEPTTVAI